MPLLARLHVPRIITIPGRFNDVLCLICALITKTAAYSTSLKDHRACTILSAISVPIRTLHVDRRQRAWLPGLPSCLACHSVDSVSPPLVRSAQRQIILCWRPPVWNSPHGDHLPHPSGPSKSVFLNLSFSCERPLSKGFANWFQQYSNLPCTTWPISQKQHLPFNNDMPKLSTAPLTLVIVMLWCCKDVSDK